MIMVQSYIIVRYIIGVESQYTLSPQQYLFLTSQDTLLPQNFNKSENLKRIQKEVDKMFETFKIIFFSSKLDQSYRNKLFSSYKIEEFLKLLTIYDRTTPLRDENNKLEIARHMIKIGFDYYQNRFQEATFFLSKINEINELLKSLNQLVSAETYEEEAMNFYRMRKHMKTPPEIYGDKDMW